MSNELKPQQKAELISVLSESFYALELLLERSDVSDFLRLQTEKLKMRLSAARTDLLSKK